MINEQQLREDLCEVGRRVWTRGFVASNDGNFSARLSDDLILCTPTMVSKGFMKPSEMAVVDLEGNHVRGNAKATSEVKLHLYIYRNRPEIQSVVHAHPAHATAFAVARKRLPKCVLPEIEVFLGEIPTTEYKTPGSWEFAESLESYIEKHHAWLLESHGVVTCGADVFEAYHRLESVEHYCRILVLAAQIGGWQHLGDNDVEALLDLRRRYGLPDLQEGRTAPQWCEGSAPSSAPQPSPPPSPQPKAQDPSTDAVLRALVRDVIERLRKP